MACFTDINVLQGNVAIFARCGETFDIRLTANLQRNFPVNFFNRLRIDRIMVMSLCGPVLFSPPCKAVTTRVVSGGAAAVMSLRRS